MLHYETYKYSYILHMLVYKSQGTKVQIACAFHRQKSMMRLESKVEQPLTVLNDLLLLQR